VIKELNISTVAFNTPVGVLYIEIKNKLLQVVVWRQKYFMF
jgi:hypothetical protein